MAVPEGNARAGGEQDGCGEIVRHRLEALGLIHGVPDDGVGDTVAGADVARDEVRGGEASAADSVLRGRRAMGDDAAMITVIATLKVQGGKGPALEEAVRPLIAHVRANEAGTLSYLFHRSTSDPTVFVFYEVYADQAALAAHGSSEPIQKFFGVVGGLLDGRPDIQMYEELGGKR